MHPVAALLITITVILLLFIQLNQQHFFVFCMMYERWANECLTVLTAAMMRARNRRQRRILQSPYAWSVPRPVESWFDLHYYDPTIPQEFFCQQLCVTRNTFKRILNMLGHHLVQQQSCFRDPLPPEKILALGLYCLGHGNLYVSIVGAIDGSRVRIKAPKDSVVDYFSRYQQHDFIIQAVVNGQNFS